MDELDLRRRLTAVDDRIARVGGRSTARYGSHADQEGRAAWLQELEMRRSEILADLARVARPAEARQPG